MYDPPTNCQTTDVFKLPQPGSHSHDATRSEVTRLRVHRVQRDQELAICRAARASTIFVGRGDNRLFFFFSVNVKEANKHLHGGLSINWAVASIYSNVVYGTNRQTMVRDLETNYSLGDSTTWYHCITAKGSALRRWQRPLINTRETLFRNDATLAWKLQLSIS